MPLKVSDAMMGCTSFNESYCNWSSYHSLSIIVVIIAKDFLMKLACILCYLFHHISDRYSLPQPTSKKMKVTILLVALCLVVASVMAAGKGGYYHGGYYRLVLLNLSERPKVQSKPNKVLAYVFCQSQELIRTSNLSGLTFLWPCMCAIGLGYPNPCHYVWYVTWLSRCWYSKAI